VKLIGWLRVLVMRVLNPDVGEARACFVAVKQAWNNGYRKVVVEGDSLVSRYHLKIEEQVLSTEVALLFLIF